MRAAYLIEIWRKLERASNREDNSHSDQLEEALADIQLLGSKEQALMARDIAKSFAETRRAELGSLLENIRNSLRNEIGLKGVEEKIIHLRIINKK